MWAALWILGSCWIYYFIADERHMNIICKLFFSLYDNRIECEKPLKHMDFRFCIWYSQVDDLEFSGIWMNFAHGFWNDDKKSTKHSPVIRTTLQMLTADRYIYWMCNKTIFGRWICNIILKRTREKQVAMCRLMCNEKGRKLSWYRSDVSRRFLSLCLVFCVYFNNCKYFHLFVAIFGNKSAP